MKWPDAQYSGEYCASGHTDRIFSCPHWTQGQPGQAVFARYRLGMPSDALLEITDTPPEAVSDQFANIFGPGRGGGPRARIAGTYDLVGEDNWYAWNMIAVVSEGDADDEQATVTFHDNDGDKMVGITSLQHVYRLMSEPSGAAFPNGLVPCGAIRQLQTLIG